MTPFWKYYFVFAYLHFLKNWPWFYSIALQCSLNPQYILTQHVLDDFGVISKTDRSQQNWTVCILNSVLSVKHQIMLDTNIYFHWCESPFSQVNFKKNIFAYHFKPRPKPLMINPCQVSSLKHSQNEDLLMTNFHETTIKQLLGWVGGGNLCLQTELDLVVKN